VIRCIEERIQQWSEYENSLERLLAWLTDAETSLKNYCLKNTLEEKQEQLEKYQVSPKRTQQRLHHSNVAFFWLYPREPDKMFFYLTSIGYVKNACVYSL